MQTKIKKVKICAYWGMIVSSRYALIKLLGCFRR